jgi:hypothetical protein
MIAPTRICRRPSAARISAVDYIVMNQRRAVNQFDYGTQVHRGSAVIARVSGGEQQKRGTQALASAAYQITCHFGYWFAGEASLTREFLFHARKVVAHQIKNLFNREQ